MTSQSSYIKCVKRLLFEVNELESSDSYSGCTQCSVQSLLGFNIMYETTSSWHFISSVSCLDNETNSETKPLCWWLLCFYRAWFTIASYTDTLYWVRHMLPHKRLLNGAIVCILGCCAANPKDQLSLSCNLHQLPP